MGAWGYSLSDGCPGRAAGSTGLRDAVMEAGQLEHEAALLPAEAGRRSATSLPQIPTPPDPGTSPPPTHTPARICLKFLFLRPMTLIATS